MPVDKLSIGALARATGTKVETIRYYERIDLLPPPARSGGNYRVYDHTHRDRLQFIRRGRDLGFPLTKIRELLRLYDDRDQSCAKVDHIAQRHLAEVERKLADLAALQIELHRLVDQCRHRTVAECRVIEALAPA